MDDLLSRQFMTEYANNSTRQRILDNEQWHISTRERKEARKQILDAVFARRRQQYQQFIQRKRQLLVNGEI